MKAVLANIQSLCVDGALIPSRAPSAERVQRSVCDVLDSNVLCTWATVAAGNRAHVNIGYFARSAALELYLLSHPGSVHCRNLTANPSMAVAVFASAQNWTEAGRGLQLFGTCKQVAGGDSDEAERIYEQRFQAYQGWRATLKPGDPALDYRFYRFVPDRVKVLDEAEFGDGVFVECEVFRTR